MEKDEDKIKALEDRYTVIFSSILSAIVAAGMLWLWA